MFLAARMLETLPGQCLSVISMLKVLRPELKMTSFAFNENVLNVRQPWIALCANNATTPTTSRNALSQYYLPKHSSTGLIAELKKDFRDSYLQHLCMTPNPLLNSPSLLTCSVVRTWQLLLLALHVIFIAIGLTASLVSFRYCRDPAFRAVVHDNHHDFS